MNIKSTTYTNAVSYKYKNSRLVICFVDKDTVDILTKRLIVLENGFKELKQLKKYNSKTTKTIRRKNSKYVIRINRIILSMTAMTCLHDSLYKLKEIINK